MKKICVVGTGYVGLTTGVCFADLGNDVACIEINQEKLEQLRSGKTPIYEPGLEEKLQFSLRAGRIRFTDQYADGVPGADFIFITVGTPMGDDGSADLSQVESAARSIGRALSGPATIIDKSTVPVGTGDMVYELIREHAGDIPFDVVSNPEFLREGSAMNDFFNPDRIVLGANNREAAERVAELHAPLRAPVIITDLRTAEMIKYASNAFLATKISFINEIAQICERLGADVKEVARGMGADKRIGTLFLEAGIGYGGSCFEADETVFVLNSPNVAAERIDTLFRNGGKPFQGEVVELITPADQRVLAFDLQTGRPTLAQVHALTRRPYHGTMVTIKTSMGRSLRVTADHPVILRVEQGFKIIPAAATVPGDQLMALCELPPVEQPDALNLLDLLAGTDLELDVYVTPIDNSFAEQYSSFASAIPAELLKYPHEIRRHNRMSLHVFRYLSERGLLDVPAAKLQLYTAKGAGTRINALIPVDADLLRLCGYYVAEGYIARDTGRAGAVRERVGLCFHANETAYIADVQRILSRWGLKFSERHATNALTTVVSSRILAWLLEHVLKCGTRSENKALPRLAYNVAADLRQELLRGAFSGDGSLTLVQQGKNALLEYATISKPLADGLALLLQTVGVIPSIRTRWMNKSKQPAYILRVSGYAQLSALMDVFGEKRRAQIEAILAGYQRQIKQRGFDRHGPYVTLTVQEVEHEEVQTIVYSMETTTGTLIASSGLISHNCFPKDVLALARMAAQAGCHPQLLQAVMEINRDARRLFVEKTRAVLEGQINGAQIGVLGLSFKPNTDDMREAPSLDIIRQLQEAGATVKAYDPVAMEAAEALMPEVIYCATPYDVAKGSDALLVVTEWNEFKQLDWERIKRHLRQPILIDGRNIYDPAEMQERGFMYHGIGRGAATSQARPLQPGRRTAEPVKA